MPALARVSWLGALALVGLMPACRLGLDYSSWQDPCAEDCPDLDASASSYAEAVLNDGPLLYLRFDEAAGDVALDASGNGRQGALSGAPERLPSEAVDGGGALRFDGVDDLVTIEDDEALRLNGDFTIELWVKLAGAAATAYPGVLQKGSPSGTGYIVFFTADYPVAIHKRADVSFGSYGEGGLFTDERYRHLGITYLADRAELRLLVDGVEAELGDVAFPTNTDDGRLHIGRGDEYGALLVDEVAIYPTALTQAQLATHVVLAHGP